MTAETIAMRIFIGLGLVILGGMGLIMLMGCCSDIWNSMPWVIKRREEYYKEHPEERPISIEEWTSEMDEVRYKMMMGALKKEKPSLVKKNKMVTDKHLWNPEANSYEF